MLPVVRLGIFSVLPRLWLENALPVGFVKGLCLHVGGDLRVGGAHLAHGFPSLPEQFPGLFTGVGAVVADAAVRVVEEVLPVGIDDGEVAVIHRKQRDFTVAQRRYFPRDDEANGGQHHAAEDPLGLGDLRDSDGAVDHFRHEQDVVVHEKDVVAL